MFRQAAQLAYGKVWLQADNTDLRIAERLEEAGIPKGDIVLGFQPPHRSAWLVNRIDEIIIFERLNEQNVITLLERKLAEIDRKLAAWGIGFRVEEGAKTFLLRHCLNDPTHRARQIKRAVRNYLEFPLSDLMLSGQLTPGMAALIQHEKPRNFLDFRVMVPRLTPGQRLSPMG